MFKQTAGVSEKYNKMIEIIFGKTFTDKSFKDLKLHKEIGNNLVYKNESENKYYIFKKDNNVWKEMTDPDMIEAVNRS